MKTIAYQLRLIFLAVQAIKAHSSLNDKDIIEAFQNGAEIGWDGFTNTSDCVEFYEKNKDVIQDLLNEQAEEFGHNSLESMIATSMRASATSMSDEIKNTLAFLILDEVGRWLIEGKN